MEFYKSSSALGSFEEFDVEGDLGSGEMAHAADLHRGRCQWLFATLGRSVATAVLVAPKLVEIRQTGATNILLAPFEEFHEDDFLSLRVSDEFFVHKLDQEICPWLHNRRSLC